MYKNYASMDLGRDAQHSKGNTTSIGIMFNKWLLSMLLLFGVLFTGFKASAQVSVTATSGTVGPTSYTTLKLAFDAINAGTHTGAITVSITANTTEGTTPATLNSSGAGSASYTSVNIRPTADGVSISGNPVTGFGVIQLNGADNVTIDGDNPNTSGTNRNLTINNTATNTVAYNSCIRLATTSSTVVPNCDNVTIKNCILVGNASARLSQTSTTGSENASFGILVAGKAGATATGAPTAITSVSNAANAMVTGTTVNSFVVDNCNINSCARGIAFLGFDATSSTSVTFQNNTIGSTTAATPTTPPYTAPTTTVYTKGIIIQGAKSLAITGNSIKNILTNVATASNAIELTSGIGSAGGTVTINNNNISAVHNYGGSACNAINISGISLPFTISGNTITDIQTTGSASATAVFVGSAGGIATIDKNTISTIYARSTGGYGATGIFLSTAANNCIIQNNIIYDLNAVDNNSATSTLGPIGIKISSGTGHKVYHNSVNLTGAALAGGTAAEPSACFMVTNTATGLDVRNNVFQNTRTGSFTGSVNCAISIVSGLTSTANFTINNNAYYVPTGTNFYLGSTNSTSTTYTTANFNPAATTPSTNWRNYSSTLSAAGTNDNASYGSVNAAPFTSATNLLLDTANSETQTALWNKGATGLGVSTDIQGETRPQGIATNPTIGADEVLINVCASATGGTFSPTTVAKCAGSTHTMSPTGFTTGAGITYQWEVSTTGGGVGFANVSGGTGATTSSYTTGPLSAGTFYYRLKVTCSNGPVTGYSNELTVTVNALPTVTVSPTSATFCSGGTPVSLTANGASTYAWAGTGTPVLSATTGNPVTASPTTSTVITVTGTDANGCSNTATATVNPSATPTTPTTTPYTICVGNTVPGGQGVVSTVPSITSGSQTINFTVSGQPTETNASPGNTVASATMSALPAGATVTGITLSYPGLVALSSSWRADIRLGLSGAIVNAAAADPSAANSSGTFNYTRTTTTGITATNSGGTINLLYWDNADDNVGSAEATFPTGTNVATLTINYSYPATINWYTASTGGTSIGTGTPFNPVGVANSGLADTNTPGAYTYYAEASNGNSCPSARTSVAFNVVSGAAITADPVAVTKCAGQSATFSVTATGPGLTYQWMKGGVDITGNASATTATLTLTNVQAADAANYSVRVSATCGSPVTSAAVALTVNALPTVAVTPTSAVFCTGGNPISLTASGASTYAWAGTGTPGLSASNGNPITSSPTTATTITVTGTDSNGCFNTATASLTLATGVSITSVTATPSSICTGANSQLLVSTSSVPYTVSAISSPVLETSGASSVTTLSTATGFPYNSNGTAGDDSYSNAVTLPFIFNFMGSPVTQMWASTNGYITFNDPVSISSTAQRSPQTLPSSTAPNNVVALFWHDMDIRTAGNVKYYTIGTAPNRKFVVEYNGVPSFTGGLLHTGQIVLNETSNTIQLYVSASASATKTLGIENSGGTSGNVGTGRNNTSWTVSTLEGWQFNPPAVTYSWTPSTFLSDATIAYPVATAVATNTSYSVTATYSGCTSAAGNVTINVSSGAAITANPVATSKCAGQTATFSVTATGVGLTYQWRKNGNNINTTTNTSAATATLSLTNVTATDNATYDVVVSSTCGSPVTSTGAALTVTTPLAGISASATTICAGDNVTLTENGGNATSWSWAPGSATTQAITVSPTSTTNYIVTATLNGCSVTANQTITVNPKPAAVTITPSTTTICAGGSVNLVAAGGNINDTPILGTGTSSTTAATTTSAIGPNPLQSYYGGTKQQMIVLASELTGLGLTNGSIISSIAFNLSVAETARTLQNLQVKVSNTALNAFSSTTFAAAGTVVRNSANYAVVTGWNTINFDTNYTWNGTSNLLIEVNFSNNDGGGDGTSTAVYSTTSFASTLLYRVDNTAAAAIDSQTTASFSAYTQRNNMRFGYTTAGLFTWTPSNSGLNTYTGANVTASPTSTTTYTATSTVNGCSSSSTATVTVLPNYTITASAGSNGTVTPSGVTTVCSGGSQSYTIAANSGYHIVDVLVGGVSQGAITSYNFTNVTANNTISATFAPDCTVPTLSTTQTNITCLNATGSATVNTTGGSSPFTYLWNDSSAQTTATATGLAAGTYNVTVTATGGCSTSTSVTITSNTTAPSTPSIAPSSGTLTCTTTSISATASSTGQGTISYSWNGGSSVSTAANSFNTAGTYTVTATDSANGCTASNSITIGSNTTPPTVNASANPGSICAGNSSSLTATGNATTYVWSPGSLSGANQTVSPASTTTYTVTGTNSTNGCTATATATVTVTAQPQWYLDADGDHYYTGTAVSSCTSPGAGYTTTGLLGGGDCNDGNNTIYPGAAEICYNNILENCTGTMSQGCAPVVVNMTPSYNNTTLASLSTAIPAVAYTYAPYTNLKYRFRITNITTNTTAADIIQTSRYVTIPASIHSYNAQYSITASAVINDEVVPFAGNIITLNSPTVQLVTLNSATCGATLAALTSTLTANPGLNATGYTFRIRLNDSNPSPTYAYSQSSTRFVSANSFTGFPLQYATSYKVAVQFTFNDPVTNLPVQSGYGSECTVNTPSIPVTTMASPTCGSQVTAMNANISATAASYATGYQFRIRLFADNGANPTYNTSVANASRFSSLTAFTGQGPLTLAYNTEYAVSVRYSILNGSTTVWSDWGPDCKVKTPFFPVTSLVPSQCGLTTATSLTQQLNITPYPGFPHYKVLLEEISGEDVINSEEKEITYAYFKLSDFSIAQLGKNYNVSVSIKLNEVFGPYDTACDLFTEAPSKMIAVVPFKATAYPNPFANNFMLDVKSSSQSNVSVKVYDMIGRMIEQKEVRVSDMETTTIGDQYPSGVYNVVVSQEESVETVRVVKR